MTRETNRMSWPDGTAVSYQSSPGYHFNGVVDGEPWQLGDGMWVVNLRDMEPAYGEFVRDPKRTRVNAAALWALNKIGGT